jgi:hypothetical protein
MVKRFLLTLCFVIIHPTLLPAAEVGPATPLGANQVLRGRFTKVHQQQLPGLPHRMEGSFVVAPEFGIILSFEKPLPTRTIVTPVGMVQAVGNETVYKLSANKSTFIKKLPGMLFAALAKNWKKLEPELAITHYGTPSAWRLTAIPKNAERDRLLFKALSAGGGAFVDQIEIQRLDGLYDFFRLSQQRLVPTDLTNEEITDFKRTLALPAS